MIETSKEFMMCPHPLTLEASLDKEVCMKIFWAMCVVSPVLNIFFQSVCIQQTVEKLVTCVVLWY